MLDRVTITGADGNTPISALQELSAEFPFVEWGILVSRKQQGSPRFPSAGWMGEFVRNVKHDRISMHVCGAWVRLIMCGEMDWNELPDIRIVANRVQINTHAEEHISTVRSLDWMKERAAHQFIIQLDGMNDHVLDAAIARGVDATGLFDTSHGAGVLPVAWPTPSYLGRYFGYAGGLGPENLATEIRRIQLTQCEFPENPFWIDMEGRVRTNEVLDLDKVRRVLEMCAMVIK